MREHLGQELSMSCSSTHIVSRMARAMTDLDESVELRSYRPQSFSYTDRVMEDGVLGIDFVSLL